MRRMLTVAVLVAAGALVLAGCAGRTHTPAQRSTVPAPAVTTQAPAAGVQRSGADTA